MRRKHEPPRPQSIQLGRVALVDEAQHFALIETATVQAPAVGTVLRVYSGNAVAAEMRATAVRRRPFLVADLVSGQPGKGDVVMQSVVGEAAATATPAQAGLPQPVPKKRGWLRFLRWWK